MNQEPIKFLLVDDIAENLVALEALLRRDGLELLKARSGPEALELLLIHEVGLALLDVQMPGMDGFELAELMRGTERTRHVPIIFITAGARDPQRIFKGYETGAVDYLTKPIDPHILQSKAQVFFDLYRQRRDLATSLRLNELFVGILGHDLRNPLEALMTGAHLLERRLSEEADLKVVGRMMSAGQRMGDMIEQLLDLTRARLGGGLGFVRTRRPLDVAALVQRAADELRDTHRDRQLIVEAAGDTATSGDRDRLLQLFSNLIANALFHGAAGRPVVVTTEGSGRDISVCVKNGGAIPPELLPTLFDPFRGRPGGASKSRGLGLGLFIARQIAVAHGGSVVVESTEASGTAFTVHLPRRGAAARPTESAEETSNVLIVDDDQSIRDSLCEAFEDEGYVALSASNGRDALARLASREARPDVVVLDLMLPVVDGQKVYAAMQADPELMTIPVIISTSMPEQAPRGVVVVPKPLKLERLFAAVRGVCRAAPSSGGA